MLESLGKYKKNGYRDLEVRILDGLAQKSSFEP